MPGSVSSHLHPLRLLACAVAGRPVHIVYLNDSGYLKGGGASSWSDGVRIYIPALLDLEQQRAQILVQSLLLAGNSLSRSLLPALIGRGKLKQRYLLLEVERCVRQFEYRIPSAFCARIVRTGYSPLPATPRESLRIATASVTLPETPSWYGTLSPVRLLRKFGAQSGGPLDDDSLQRLESQLQQLAQELAEGDEEDAVKDSFWQLLASPKGKAGVMSNILQDLLGFSSSPAGQGGDSGANSSTEMVSGRVASRLHDLKNALRSTLARETPSAFLLQDSGAHSYPEWDCSNNQYRDNWVSVEEVEAWSEGGENAVTDFTSGSSRQLQKTLAGLCFDVERHANQAFGDDLSVDRLVDMHTDLRAGFSGDERVYQANLKTRRSLGVQILVDASSSTAEEASGGKRICDLQMAVAWQLCQAFSLLGDRVAMHGFHSWGRALVRLQRLKNFNEPMGAIVAQRGKQLAVAGYTRVGAAIRHSLKSLRCLSGMPFNLLLVISDGYPYDDQYEGEYAAEDTRKALEEARRENIACVCIAVGSDVNSDKLRAIYGNTNYLALRNPGALDRNLRAVIEAAIAATVMAAGVSRRSSQ